MLFGNKETYGIEVYIDSKENLFGGMCLYFSNIVLGDIDYSYDTLVCVYSSLLRVSENIEDLSLPKTMESMGDVQIFNLIYDVLYTYGEYEESLSYKEIVERGKDFWKYDFLTQGGVNFDGFTFFIYFKPPNNVTIPTKEYASENDDVRVSTVKKEQFIEITNQFLQWYKIECKKIGILI